MNIMKKHAIIDIPEKMQKYYGRGKMLHPDTESIEAALQMIPPRRVVTVEALCRKLSDDFGTHVTCPMRTTNILKRITERPLADESDTIPFWRVIRNNRTIINSKMKEACAAKLEQEGLTLEFTEKGEISVDTTPERLYSF